jgi:transposase
MKCGCKFEIVDEAYTTMTCSICGDICLHEPNEREFICPCCHRKLYRDINSAINIGVKAKVLSSSDYKGMDLSKPLYTANYNLRKQRVSGWN